MFCKDDGRTDKALYDLNTKVNQLVKDAETKEAVIATVDAYRRDGDVKRLTDELKLVIRTPSHLPVFDEIRPVIPLHHQLQYDSLTPRPPSPMLHQIRLQKQGCDSLGFAVRGGLEHGTSVFVSSVTPGSQAHSHGLRIGDEIVKVNGFTIKQAVHEDVLSLIQSKPHIELTVRAVSMIPVKESVNDSLSWNYVEIPPEEETVREKTARVYINLTGTTGLGCSICSGPVCHPGVFIQSIKVGGVAEKAGLGVSDQIARVNDTSFYNISHAEAVMALRRSPELYLTIRQGAGEALFGRKDMCRTAIENEELQQLRGSILERDRESMNRGDHERKVFDEKRLQKEEQKKKNDEEFEKSRLRQAESKIVSKKEDQWRKESEEEGKSNVEGECENKPNLDAEETLSLLSVVSAHPFPQHDTVTPSRSNMRNSDMDSSTLFTAEQIDGRQIKTVPIVKGGSFGLDIEEGLRTPFGGKIIVSEVYVGGTVANQGGIHKGDQLMTVDGQSLLDISKIDALDILEDVQNNSKSVVNFIVAKKPPLNYEDQISLSLRLFPHDETYF